MNDEDIKNAEHMIDITKKKMKRYQQLIRFLKSKIKRSKERKDEKTQYIGGNES